MIKSIYISEKKLHLRKAFKITYEEVRNVDVIFLKITDSEGNIGLGSASPDTHVTGETSKKIHTSLKKYLTEDFFNMPLDHWYRYHEKIQIRFRGLPTTQACVEEALLNLFCNKYQIQLKNLFGGYRDTCQTMMTIGVLPYEETLAQVRKNIKIGYKTIKLKCGLNVNEDIKKIRAVKKILLKNHKLILDANQGYNLQEAIKLLKSISSLKIDLIEEPVKGGRIKDLKTLKQLDTVPIVADESILSLSDAFRLLAEDIVDGVNIKLIKCGGPINFLNIFHLAKSLSKITMIGCNYESTISMTTSVHLALALPIDFIDLDSGHLDFNDDPVKGGYTVHEGIIKLKKGLALL